MSTFNQVVQVGAKWCVLRHGRAAPRTLEAVEIMDRHKIGCLPVVHHGKLVGIVTEHDFVEISKSLLHRWLRED